MNLNSIKFRIVALSALCVIVATGMLVAFSILSANKTSVYVTQSVEDLLDRSAKESLARLASTQAAVIKSEVDSAFNAARTMARSLEVIGDKNVEIASPSGSRRTQLNSILLRVLKDNPRFNGTYSAWQPNAIDGADSQFVGKTEVGSDATGRALPYWTRDPAGKIAIQPLVEYDSTDLHPNGVMKGGWFIGPQRTGKESILAPLPYIVQGRAVFLATMSVPISVNGTFVGVAGADFDLAFVQTLATKVNNTIYDGKGTVAIVSSAGLVVASSANPTAIGGTFTAIDPRAADYADVLKQGREYITVDTVADRLSVFSPLPLGRTGDNWSVIITEPRSVLMAEANKMSTALFERSKADVFWQIVAAFGVAVAAIVSMAFVGQGISGPIGRLTAVLRKIANGEAIAEIAGAKRKDEIGDISRAVDQIRLGAEAESRRKVETEALAQAAREKDRRDTMLRLANEFEQAMGSAVQGVGNSTEQLQRATTTMSASVGKVSTQSTSAAGASNEAATNVQTVASAAEELSSSIGEIKRQVDQSAVIASTAAAEAESTAAKVRELSNSAQKIGQVVDLINNIAGQTNLLALNATIEAARAGDAGRGFAVVAAEVKELANQTSKATSEIASQIGEIQTSTQASAAAIVGITDVIAEINRIAASIASAVDQQGTATAEIAHNVTQAAAGTQMVNRNMDGISSAVRDQSNAAGQVESAVHDLAKQSDTLRQVMQGFLSTIRAG